MIQDPEVQLWLLVRPTQTLRGLGLKGALLSDYPIHSSVATRFVAVLAGLEGRKSGESGVAAEDLVRQLLALPSEPVVELGSLQGDWLEMVLSHRVVGVDHLERIIALYRINDVWAIKLGVVSVGRTEPEHLAALFGHVDFLARQFESDTSCAEWLKGRSLVVGAMVDQLDAATVSQTRGRCLSALDLDPGASPAEWPSLHIVLQPGAERDTALLIYQNSAAGLSVASEALPAIMAQREKLREAKSVVSAVMLDLDDQAESMRRGIGGEHSARDTLSGLDGSLRDMGNVVERMSHGLHLLRRKSQQLSVAAENISALVDVLGTAVRGGLREAALQGFAARQSQLEHDIRHHTEVWEWARVRLELGSAQSSLLNARWSRTLNVVLLVLTFISPLPLFLENVGLGWRLLAVAACASLGAAVACALEHNPLRSRPRHK